MVDILLMIGIEDWPKDISKILCSLESLSKFNSSLTLKAKTYHLEYLFPQTMKNISNISKHWVLKLLLLMDYIQTLKSASERLNALVCSRLYFKLPQKIHQEELKEEKQFKTNFNTWLKDSLKILT